MSAPALTCAGCGREGRPSTIVWDRSKPPEDPRPVVVPVFGWHADGRTGAALRTLPQRASPSSRPLALFKAAGTDGRLK